MPTITINLDFLWDSISSHNITYCIRPSCNTFNNCFHSAVWVSHSSRSRNMFTYSLLLHMLAGFVFLQFSSENQEVWEESLQCVSLLVQLYGGDGDDCLSPSCLRSFEHLLHAQMQTESLRIQRTALRIIKRLVSSPHMVCRRTHHWYLIEILLCHSRTLATAFSVFSNIKKIWKK